MAAAAPKTFAERLLVLYGAPKSTDDAAFIREYNRLLRGYSPEIVDAAIDTIARKHKWPRWPTIAECCAAAEDAIEARHARQRAENGGTRPDSDRIGVCRVAAPRFVNGPGGYAWEWSPEFRVQPLVVLAEAEGWGRELRAACKRDAFVRFLHGLPRDAPTVERVMPKNAEDIAYWRAQARRTREAAQWRKEHPNSPAIKGLEEFDAVAYLRRLGIKQPATAARPHSEVVDPETGKLHDR